MSDDRVFAKCAWQLMPLIMLIYLANFLDRVNVGFAALGMNKDLGFSPAVFGFGAGIFFVGYAAFQVPANLILDRIGARLWLFCIVAVWGAISASCAFVQGEKSFYTLRFLLGLAEAGFVPGVIFYLTLWFPKAYRTRFTALFLASGPVAVVIGGPISGLILGMDNLLGLQGWQWLFLLEGTPACLLAIAILRVLPDGPSGAAWLNSEEKDFIASRLAAEDGSEHREWWRALLDYRVYMFGIANFGLLFGLVGVTLWMPQIVKATGFSDQATGFFVAGLSVPSALAMVLWGLSSDARDERVWHSALPMLLAATSFVAAATLQPGVPVLLALGVAQASLWSAIPSAASLPSTFLRGSAAAVGIALFVCVGQVGGFFGPYVIGVLTEITGSYASGMVAPAIGLVVGAVLVLAVGRMLTAPRATSGRNGAESKMGTAWAPEP